MRAAVFREPGRALSIETVSDPEPAADQVVIKVAKCGICSSDVTNTEPGSPMLYPQGARLGHEYAGEIVAIGSEVRGCAVGERVTAIPMTGCARCPACAGGDPFGCSAVAPLMGGFGEYTLARAPWVTRLPDELDFADGALIEPLACGSRATHLAQVHDGSRVLVVGTGPIGLSAVWWSARLGARVVATARTGVNADVAVAMGAAEVIRQGPEFAERVLAAFGCPPDVVVDCAGTAGVTENAIQWLGSRGTLVCLGMCFDRDRWNPGAAMLKQATIRFSLGYTTDDFRRSAAMLAAGHVEPRAMLGKTLSLAELPHSVESMRTSRSATKIMVEPWR